MSTLSSTASVWASISMQSASELAQALASRDRLAAGMGEHGEISHLHGDGALVARLARRIQGNVELVLGLGQAPGFEIERAEIAGGPGHASRVVHAQEQIHGLAIARLGFVGPLPGAMDVAEIEHCLGGAFGRTEFLIEAKALGESRARLVEAAPLEQDRAEIETGPRHAVLALELSLEAERLARHRLGAVEVLRLAIEQSEIAGGNGGDRRLAQPVGDGQALDHHLLGLWRLAEALQQQAEIGVELGEAEFIFVLGAERRGLIEVDERPVAIARFQLRRSQARSAHRPRLWHRLRASKRCFGGRRIFRSPGEVRRA